MKAFDLKIIDEFKIMTSFATVFLINTQFYIGFQLKISTKSKSYVNNLT